MSLCTVLKLSFFRKCSSSKSKNNFMGLLHFSILYCGGIFEKLYFTKMCKIFLGVALKVLLRNCSLQKSAKYSWQSPHIVPHCELPLWRCFWGAALKSRCCSVHWYSKGGLYYLHFNTKVCDSHWRQILVREKLAIDPAHWPKTFHKCDWKLFIAGTENFS